MSDYTASMRLFVDRSRVFINQNVPTYVVLHKTAGFTNLQDLGAYFASTALVTSSHYGVGLSGDVAQFVLEQDGSAANCCLSQGHADFLVDGPNYNMQTISIEHIDPAIDNSTPLTDKQKLASFQLVADICKRQRIPPMRAVDTSGGILLHSDLDPVNRSRCPGNYPLEELLSYLVGSVHMGIPSGWTDENGVLTAPNGQIVVQGFREFILAHPWDSDDYPLEHSRGLSQVEMSNHATGKGTAQTFRKSRLVWTPERGSFLSWLGAEYLWYLTALSTEATTKSHVVQKEVVPATLLADIKKLCLDAGIKTL